MLTLSIHIIKINDAKRLLYCYKHETEWILFRNQKSCARFESLNYFNYYAKLPSPQLRRDIDGTEIDSFASHTSIVLFCLGQMTLFLFVSFHSAMPWKLISISMASCGMWLEGSGLPTASTTTAGRRYELGDIKHRARPRQTRGGN